MTGTEAVVEIIEACTLPSSMQKRNQRLREIVRAVAEPLREALIKLRERTLAELEDPPDFVGTGSPGRRELAKMERGWEQEIKDTVAMIDAALATTNQQNEPTSPKSL